MTNGLLLALVLATMPWPASAACPGHQTSITASPAGEFRICAQEMDGGTPPLPVGQDFYRDCQVTSAWQGGTATVTVTAPLPGVAYLVGFPSATGEGGATANCTNANGLTGPISASRIIFPAPKLELGTPQAPALAQ